MTRINIVPPAELYDQHLVAEYREIFMVGSSLQRSLRSAAWDARRIPERYTLNKGHVMFFYDKGRYLRKRYHSLLEQMLLRGMSPNMDRVWRYEQWPDYLYNDWEPSEQDLAIARQRIAEKIVLKPNWYRKTGEMKNENK